MISIPVETILSYFSTTREVYVFGSCADGEETRKRDMDIALLLPYAESSAAGSLALSGVRFDLEKRLGRSVDVVNLQIVSTVFQKEIIASGVRVYCPHEDEGDTFEMLVMSKYAKLNEERADILASFYATRRAYAV